MTRTAGKIGNWIAKITVGFIACVFIYDLLMPIYSDVKGTKTIREWRGMSALITFKKERYCGPVKGSVVGFVHYQDGYREPVVILNSIGEPLTLKNFPPSETPVSSRLTWKLPIHYDNPESMSISFHMQCITPIEQRIEWFVHVPYEAPP